MLEMWQWSWGSRDIEKIHLLERRVGEYKEICEKLVGA